MVKKILCLSLLTLLLLQVGGLLFVYRVQQCSVQYKMQERLNSSNAKFEKITLSLYEYQKSKVNAHEIRLKGEMYDVKSVLIMGNKVSLLAINDKEEEHILNKIKDFINPGHKSDSKLPSTLQQLLSLHYLSPKTESVLFISSFSFKFWFTPNAGILNNNRDVTTPPPQLV